MKKLINKNYRLENNNGITLIVLVITIVLLIILSGISINLVFGENGIIQRAQNASKSQTIAQIQEKLELEKVAIASKNDGIALKNIYLEHIKSKGIINDEDIEEISANNAYITVNGQHIFLIEQEENKNLKIEYIGKAGTDIKRPIITEVIAAETTVTIKATDEASGIVGYNITTVDERPTEFIECENTTSLDVTIENKPQGITYYVWVKDAAGNISLSKSAYYNKQTIKGDSITDIIAEDVSYINVTTSGSVSYSQNISYSNYTSDGWSQCSGAGCGERHNGGGYPSITSAVITDATTGETIATVNIANNIKDQLVSAGIDLSTKINISVPTQNNAVWGMTTCNNCNAWCRLSGGPYYYFYDYYYTSCKSITITTQK